MAHLSNQPAASWNEFLTLAKEHSKERLHDLKPLSWTAKMLLDCCEQLRETMAMMKALKALA